MYIFGVFLVYLNFKLYFLSLFNLPLIHNLTTLIIILSLYIYIYIYLLGLPNLAQIHFNGTHFINARLTKRAFSIWPVAQPIVGEMEMHSVAKKNDISDPPFATFFPFKKARKPYLVSETRWYCRESARSCCPSTRTPLSLSLFSTWRRGAALSVKHRYYVASLILHASVAKITARLLSLSYVYLISSDDGSIIRIFVQINISEGRAGYVVLMGHVSITFLYYSVVWQ